MAKLERKPTQRDKILAYIRRFGCISSWEAYSELGVTQLGARIFELKELGYQLKAIRTSCLKTLLCWTKCTKQTLHTSRNLQCT